MFEELMHSIWEEFSKRSSTSRSRSTRTGPADLRPERRQRPGRADLLGGAPDGQPSALQQVAADAGPIEAVAGTAADNGGTEVIETVVKDERENIGQKRPLLVRVRQEVQEVPRCVARLESRPGARVIRAFNERDLDGFVAVLDPEVELHSMKGSAEGRDAARFWATRPRRGTADESRSRSCSRTTRVRRRQGIGADQAGLALGRGRLGGGGGRDGLALRAARAPPNPQLAALRRSRGCLAGVPWWRWRPRPQRIVKHRGLERAALRDLRSLSRAGHRRPWRARRGRDGGASTTAGRSGGRPRLRLR